MNKSISLLSVTAFLIGMGLATQTLAQDDPKNGDSPGNSNGVVNQGLVNLVRNFIVENANSLINSIVGSDPGAVTVEETDQPINLESYGPKFRELQKSVQKDTSDSMSRIEMHYAPIKYVVPKKLDLSAQLRKMKAAESEIGEENMARIIAYQSECDPNVLVNLTRSYLADKMSDAEYKDSLGHILANSNSTLFKKYVDEKVNSTLGEQSEVDDKAITKFPEEIIGKTDCPKCLEEQLGRLTNGK